MEKERLEIETSLIICSNRPRDIAAEICKISTIGDYRLLSQASRSIRDLYLDTSDRALLGHKLSLRIRQEGEKICIALKGQGRPTEAGGLERLEIEMPWSRDSLDRMTEEIASREIPVKEKHGASRPADPVEAMEMLGLMVIQDRSTIRKVRAILPAKGGAVQAELVLDSVTYHIGRGNIYHDELEIEGRIPSPFRAFEVVVGRLLDHYGPTLRRWNHSKLATGMALEKFMDKGILPRLLDPSCHLMPSAYDTIDTWIMERGLSF